MVIADNYVLILGQETEDLNGLQSSLNHLAATVAIANSVDQAVEQASQLFPSLVILLGNQQQGSSQLIVRLRQMAGLCGVTIVELSEFQASSWLDPDSDLAVDGYLVKPIERDILVSLIQSAWARQKCCDALLSGT
ncbi:MAG: hypothetical protein LRZ84_08875 [Desertifilum sp.]|nr:hypothetical protein [Desertifilum sp.]